MARDGLDDAQPECRPASNNAIYESARNLALDVWVARAQTHDMTATQIHPAGQLTQLVDGVRRFDEAGLVPAWYPRGCFVTGSLLIVGRDSGPIRRSVRGR